MSQRTQELRQILEERRREVTHEVRKKIREIRETTRNRTTIIGFGELRTEIRVQEDPQDDIEFALIQIKTETLIKINEVLVRLDEGSYGYCFECGEEIASNRLRALPFAIRCKNCEEAREETEFRQRLSHNRRFLFLSW